MGIFFFPSFFFVRHSLWLLFYHILFSLPFQGIHYRTSEESSIRFMQPKNYGSITGNIADNLTYTWSCVDAFGAVDQNGHGFRNITHKIKRLIHSDRNIPKPRKQLLKNGWFRVIVFHLLFFRSHQSHFVFSLFDAVILFT